MLKLVRSHLTTDELIREKVNESATEWKVGLQPITLEQYHGYWAEKPPTYFPGTFGMGFRNASVDALAKGWLTNGEFVFAVKTLLLVLLLTLAAYAQEQFDVSCPLPQGWSGFYDPTGVTTNPTASKRFSIVREQKTSSPFFRGALEVEREAPTPLEELRRQTFGSTSEGQKSWEETTFQNYPCQIFHRRDWVDPQPYAKYRLVEVDLYFVRFSEQLGARITLEREAWEETQDDRILDTTPGRRILEELLAQQNEALHSLRFVFPSQPVPVPVPPPAPETEIPWATLAGVAGAGLLATAVALAARKKPSAPVPVQAPPVQAPAVYVLQVSSARLQFSQSAPATLTISVWRVDPIRKTYQLAQEASIEVKAIPPLPQLKIKPQRSPGRLVCQLTVEGSAPQPTGQLQVEAAAEGTKHQCQVQWEIQDAYEWMVEVTSTFKDGH